MADLAQRDDEVENEVKNVQEKVKENLDAIEQSKENGVSLQSSMKDLKSTLSQFQSAQDYLKF